MRVLFALSLIFSAVCFPAFAQDGDAETRAALSERLIDLTARANIDKVMTDMIDAQASTLNSLTEEQRTWYEANALTLLMPHLERMIDSMELRYAEVFSTAELSALVAFYETAEGQQIALKQNEIGAELGAQMGTVGRAYAMELRDKFCSEFGCPDPVARSSAAKD